MWPLPPAVATAVLPQTRTHFTCLLAPPGAASRGWPWAKVSSSIHVQWASETFQIKKKKPIEQFISVYHITLFFSMKTYFTSLSPKSKNDEAEERSKADLRSAEMQRPEVKWLNRGRGRGSSPVKGGWDGQRRAVAWRCGTLPVYIPYGCMAELDCGCGAPVYGNEGSLVQSVNRSWNIIVPRRRCHHQGGAWYRPRTLPRCYKKEDKENKSSRSKSRATEGGGGLLKSPKTAAGSREKQVFRLLIALKPKLHLSSTESWTLQRVFTQIAVLQNTFSVRMVFTRAMMIFTFFFQKLPPSA